MRGPLPSACNAVRVNPAVQLDARRSAALHLLAQLRAWAEAARNNDWDTAHRSAEHLQHQAEQDEMQRA